MIQRIIAAPFFLAFTKLIYFLSPEFARVNRILWNIVKNPLKFKPKLMIMARRLKITGFARFFLFLLIAGPLAYLGASYYNGEDGLENIKSLFNNQNSESTTVEKREDSSTEERSDIYDGTIERLKDELEYKNRRLDSLFEENVDLKKRLEALEIQLND